METKLYMSQSLVYGAMSQEDKDKNIPQYTVGKVPGTNVDVIALFPMLEFNASDAMKHGTLRQNTNTDTINGYTDLAKKYLNDLCTSNFGSKLKLKDKELWKKFLNGEYTPTGNEELTQLNQSDYENVASTYRTNKNRIPVTYDNGVEPNIKNNFSLPDSYINESYDYYDGNKKQDHFRKNYGLGGASYQNTDSVYDANGNLLYNQSLPTNNTDRSNGYTSIAQFIDKSILCASYALRSVGYKPNIIVSAPSSSKFNEYYCYNLSNKLGIRYIKDFFKRDLINIKFTPKTELLLKQANASEKDILTIKDILRRAVFGEIGMKLKEYISNWIDNNSSLFSNFMEVNKINKVELLDSICLLIQKEIVSGRIDKIIENNLQSSGEEELLKYRKSQFTTYRVLARTIYNSNKKTNGERVNKIIKFLRIDGLMEIFFNVDRILIENVKKITKGFKVTLDPFKITKIDARFRHCITGAYIVSDDYVNKETQKLKTFYTNSNFLIFDEDIDTGGTLSIVTNSLLDKLSIVDSDSCENQVKCLVNGRQDKIN